MRVRNSLFIAVALLCVLFVFASSSAWALAMDLISKDQYGSPGVGQSMEPSISADGRFVAFASTAELIDGLSTGGKEQVYVVDRETGTMQMVSVTPTGTAGGSYSYEPAISADGRVVAFTSDAHDLVSEDTGIYEHVYIRDLRGGTTQLVSINAGGEPASGYSWGPSVSGDGRYVAFATDAPDMLKGLPGVVPQVFVRDMEKGAIELISVAVGGGQGNGESWNCSISGDGDVVAFDSSAQNLIAGFTSSDRQVFARYRGTSQTMLISHSADGDPADGDSQWASISGDGDCVGFESDAQNLIRDMAPTSVQVYGKAVGTRTRLISRAPDGGPGDNNSTSVSLDTTGGKAAFESYAENLVPGVPILYHQIYALDRTSGAMRLLSLGYDGASGDDDSLQPSISGDGNYVVFSSKAANLMPGVSGQQIYLVVFDVSRPTVTVNQAAGQADPTELSPIKFTALFSEPVYGFESADVTLGGTAGATTAEVGNPSKDHKTFVIEVSGMTANGTVTVSIPDGASHDASDNTSIASTSTDNAVTYAPKPPQNLSVTPSGGTLDTTARDFVAAYTDPSGYADIKKAYLLINDSFALANACLVMYDAATNKVYLKNDANSSWGTGYAPGAGVTLQNSQCYVYVSATTASRSGDNLTLSWRIALKSAHAAKNLNAYMYVLDALGQIDGWEKMAIYYNVKPQAVSIDPNSEVIDVSSKTSLTSLYRDANGSGDIRKCYTLICENFSQSNAMFLFYDVATNKVYLKNDTNTSWGTGYAPGTDVKLENSQCLIYVRDIVVSKAGNDLTVNWVFSLQPSMEGKNLFSWMYVTDIPGLYDGWKKVGTHFTPVAPTCLYIDPASGTVPYGVSQAFTAAYVDDNGYGDIYRCYLQLSVTSSQANAVLAFYDAKLNKVYLRNDANTSWGVGVTPGAAVTLENSQCILRVADIVLGNPDPKVLVVVWPVELKPSQSGKKLCERMFVRDNELLYSGWKVKGYVRVE